MRCTRSRFAACAFVALIARTGAAAADPCYWDFEDGTLQGWTSAAYPGYADPFLIQPTLGDNVTVSRVAAPGFVHPMLDITRDIGGDYWDTAYDIGHQGDYWIGTYEYRHLPEWPLGTVQGDWGQGTLVSPVFTLETPWIAFLIGGGYRYEERVQLEVLETSPEDGDALAADFVNTYSRLPSSHPLYPLTLGSVRGADGWVMVHAATADIDRELMDRVFWNVERFAGRFARIRIVDKASDDAGHINADAFVCTFEAPPEEALHELDRVIHTCTPNECSCWTDVTLGIEFCNPPGCTPGETCKDRTERAMARLEPPRPLWGYADVHNHFMAHLGFGGRVLRYSPEDLPDDILAGCYGEFWAHDFCYDLGGVLIPTYHWGGLASGAVIDELDKTAGHHLMAGALSLVHQQMQIDWLRRAWAGGLRLMVAKAVHSRALEFLMGWPEPFDGLRYGMEYEERGPSPGPAWDGVWTTAEWYAIEMQVWATIDVVARNADFMEIAFSPSDARRIIRDGKLAVILGFEAAELGTNPIETIEWLHALGIRDVTPIHSVDNALGGAAVFEEVYNAANEFYNGDWFTVEEGATLSDPVGFKLNDRPPRGCVEAPWSDWYVPDACVPDYVPAMCRWDGSTVKPDTCRSAHCMPGDRRLEYDPFTAHINAQGLTAEGEDFLLELMKRGMVLDTDHMSERTVNEVIFNTVTTPAGGVDPIDSYPVVSSHSDFRTLYRGGDGPDEAQRSLAQVQRIRALGGMVAPMVNAGNPTAAPGSAVANDCAGASSSWAQKYAFALSMMGNQGVAMGTDFNAPGVSKPAPRFGSRACPWESSPVPQSNAVNYSDYPASLPIEVYTCEDKAFDGTSAATSACASIGFMSLHRAAHPPLVKWSASGSSALVDGIFHRAGFDINFNGLNNVAMLPDFLQDLKNVGVGREQLSPLFRSADDYITLWEKSCRIAGMFPDGVGCF